MNVTQQIADKAVGAPIPTRKGTELGKASIKIIVIIALAAFVTLMILSRTQDERTEKIVQAQASGPQSPFEEVHAQTEAARGGKPTGPSLTPDYEETSMIVEQVALGLLALLTIGLCAHRFAPVIAESLNTRFNPWVPQLAGVDRSLTAGMDAQRLAQFAAALKATARPAQEDTVPWSSSNSQAQTSAPTPLDAKFFEIAAEKLEVIRKLFIQASGASEQDAQLKIVAELNNKLRSFSMVCEASELAPARQLAMGVEGLLKQAAEKYEYLTASVLRTGANAIVLLQKLCQPGNNRVLTKDHQPRFLVVDDDPISRHAVSSALKKVFSQPDAAENGEAALKLAAENAYDVIFLDVEMPGMDGFEVCMKLHQIQSNQKTPVVFVTLHSDFDSRAKSAKVGGHDLIGKPFLPFEITVKALTLVLQAGGPRKENSKLQTPSSILLRQKPYGGQGETPNSKLQTPTAAASAGFGAETVNVADFSPRKEKPGVKEGASRLAQTGNGDFVKAFLAEAPAAVRNLQASVRGLWERTTEGGRHEMPGDLYIDVHNLAEDAKRAGLDSISSVAAAVEGLFAQLHEEPKLATRSVLETASSAFDLIAELCGHGAEEKLEQARIHILVVDDDPISLRAMCNALQHKFGKPECAESGSAAMSLACQQTYDVVFMDARMPGIDGFTACSEIRKLTANRSTPVVFVTNLSDLESQAKCSVSGGSAFIAKPVFPAQIALAALVFSLRGRLARLTPAAMSGH